MGLAARQMEEAGLSTVCLSPIPAFTAAVGAPRVAAVAHPTGVTMGPAGDADRQRAVLRAALLMLERASEPGEITHLPFEWHEPRLKAMRPPKELPPIAKLLVTKPWNLARFIKGDIPADRPRNHTD